MKLEILGVIVVCFALCTAESGHDEGQGPPLSDTKRTLTRLLSLLSKGADLADSPPPGAGAAADGGSDHVVSVESRQISTCTATNSYTLNNDAGLLQQGGYCDYMDVCYHIAIQGSVRITWGNIFDVEASSGGCDYDYVSVYSSYGTPAQALAGTYCGTSAPQDLTINGPVYVYFHSDSSNGGQWSLYWTSVAFDTWWTYEYHVNYASSSTSNVANTQGQYQYQQTQTQSWYFGSISTGYTSSRGYPLISLTVGQVGDLFTTGYPGYYASGSDYGVTMAYSGNIRIEFLHFDIQYEPTCRRDYIKIVDATGRWWSFCGNILPAISIYRGPIDIIFHSDNDGIGGTGFDLKYTCER